MICGDLYPERVAPRAWLDGGLSAVEMIGRLIEIGDSLVRGCDETGQPVAGNYIAMALDILRAESDLTADIGPVP